MFQPKLLPKGFQAGPHAGRRGVCVLKESWAALLGRSQSVRLAWGRFLGLC